MGVFGVFLGAVLLTVSCGKPVFGQSQRSGVMQTALEEKSEDAPEPRPGSRSPEAVMRAYADSYPQAVERVEFRNEDWAVLLRGKWFYHAGGRLLPEEHRAEAESYARQSFYGYFPGLPAFKVPEGEAAERLGSVPNRRRANPLKRDPEFYDTLWQAHNKEESYANLIYTVFLGKRFLVHRGIVEPLDKINALILKEAETEPELRQWIDSLGSISAWSWREVAATASRSYHAYGVAVDIQPKRLRGLATYWQWAAESNPEWYKIPYSGRWHPPLSVVEIFERYGFCWGGKWPLFDTMHFEYRPEILRLNGMVE